MDKPNHWICMENIIYTSYLNKVTSPIIETLTFEVVIRKIQNGEYANLVQKIRDTQEGDHKKKEYKSELPVFFPTLDLGSLENKLGDNSKPTGIIQFDIDVKDNPNLDFDIVRKELMALNETYYVFTSPSGGLKFGIKSDFTRHIEEKTSSLKDRYKKSYNIVKDHLLSILSVCIIDDPSVGNLKQACFLSYDPHIYFNSDCGTFKVDSLCVYLLPEIKVQDNEPSSHYQIEELLSYIPQNYSYDERLPINASLFSLLGAAAIPILDSHWITTNRTKLKSDLEFQYRKVLSGELNGNLGVLINKAQSNGYADKKGKSRNKLRPEPIEHSLTPLLSHEEATNKLENVMNAFFNDGKSCFINFSAGAGKTYTLLKILEKIDLFSKILYLVKTHELAEEIVSTFKQIRIDRIKTSSFKENLKHNSSIAHFKGREALCENLDIKNLYRSRKIPIPSSQCSMDCHYEAECEYTYQFSNPFENIRVMMHNEYFNEKSKYFSGIDAEGNPSSTAWIPDFIIIDENVFQKDGDYSENYTSKFQSIVKIIDYVNTGKSLEEAVIDNRIDLIRDNIANVPNKKPKFTNAAQYLQDYSSNKEKISSYSLLLENLTQYAITENPSYLHGVRLENNVIRQSILKPISNRHINIPTLFLDATANAVVIKKLFTDIDYHEIYVKSKPGINLYQLCNKTITKKFIANKENQEHIIIGLHKLKNKYKNIGLITYKKIDGINDFDRFMANQLKIDVYDHFGNLRGINKFSEVDCLIILGRYCININALQEYSYAIFNNIGDQERSYLNSYVRMKDGTSQLLNSKIHNDPITRAISDHFSLSETQQAIGRGRMIHGKPKDIYYLSNEHIGSNIEVTGFLNYDDMFFKPLIGPGYLAKVNEIGFIKDKQKIFIDELGLTRRYTEQYPDKIIKELLDDAFICQKVIYQNKHRKKVEDIYFIKDNNKFNQFMLSKQYTVLSQESFQVD